MTVFLESIPAWCDIRRSLAQNTVGFVPTMGALHRGHFSLVERSTAECDVTVVSVFVNPTQFSDQADLEKYPQDQEGDRAALEDYGVDYGLFPTFQMLYPDEYRYKVAESGLSAQLCGASRPGHFDGVLTVVMRLLNIVRPHRAYFGEKDYQQYLLIRDMVQSFFMDIEIVPCPTVREEDGVALSSRNRRLSAGGRKQAAAFAKQLREGNSPERIRSALESLGITVEYVAEDLGRRFGAVFVDGVRLIDNVVLG